VSKALIYSKEGKILKYVDVATEMLDLQIAEGDLYIELENSDYVDKYIDIQTLELLNFPEQPSKFHIWNWETKQWQEPENYQQLLFNEAASKVKRERQRLLTATDWTDTVSASTRLENYNEWQFYRQQLRDITTLEGYPFNVVWPTQPV
jgi:hypothetical protein